MQLNVVFPRLFNKPHGSLRKVENASPASVKILAQDSGQHFKS